MCGVRGGSTALQFSFISDILGIVVLVQMLNVFFHQFWMYFMKVHLQYFRHISVSDVTCGKSFELEQS